MRFSTTTIFAAVAVLCVCAVQALPMSGGASDSLSTREPSYNDLLERGLDITNADMYERGLDMDGADMYERGLDVALESDTYMSKRMEYVNSLERRAPGEDECAICLQKIRAPKGLGSFCQYPQHEQCRQCIEQLAKQEGAKCPMCRGPLVAANLTFRVCRPRTPPPPPPTGPLPPIPKAGSSRKA